MQYNWIPVQRSRHLTESPFNSTPCDWTLNQQNSRAFQPHLTETSFNLTPFYPTPLQLNPFKGALVQINKNKTRPVIQHCLGILKRLFPNYFIVLT